MSAAISQRNLWLRRVSQGLFLALWSFLFWEMAHEMQSVVPADLFLLTNPLATAVAMAAARVWVPAVLFSLILVGLTLLWGRFFCGWICPLGTCLDIIGTLWKGRGSRELQNDHAWRRLKYYLLVATGAAALVGGQVVYHLDPLVLMSRGVSEGLFPSTPGQISFLVLAILLLIIGLVAVTPRFYCRYLCPLGAFYGALARFSIYRRKIEGCDNCDGRDGRECESGCSMGANPSVKSDPAECIRCMACQSDCHARAITFEPTVPMPASREAVARLDRRTFLVSAGAGAIVGAAALQAHAGTADPRTVVRPPMVVDEDAFAALCLRCGQCTRACPTGALQPLLLEIGFAGLWTPAIAARIGGCIDDCNACSEACPTEAIPLFGPTRPEKWSVKMGHVLLEHAKCITYAPGANKPCLKCVAVCPNRAITVVEDHGPARPGTVLYDRCVGCALCIPECHKMVLGEPALTLSAHGVGVPTLLVVDPTPILPAELRDAG